MPVAPLRPCAEPNCGALVQKGRCQVHTKVKDRARGTAQERGYTYQWSLFSKRWLEQHPLCGERMDGVLYAEHSRCWQAGRYTATDLVTDHIKPLADGGAHFDERNCQTLCRSCNSAKDNGHG